MSATAVVQFGLAIMPRWFRHLRRFISGMTSGTSSFHPKDGGIVDHDCASVAARCGAYCFEIPPALKKARSIPAKEFSASAATSCSSPRKRTRLPGRARRSTAGRKSRDRKCAPFQHAQAARRRPRRSRRRSRRDSFSASPAQCIVPPFQMKKSPVHHPHFRRAISGSICWKTARLSPAIRFPLPALVSDRTKEASRRRPAGSGSRRRSVKDARSGQSFKSRVPVAPNEANAPRRRSGPDPDPVAGRPGTAQREHPRPFHLHSRNESRGPDRRAGQPRLHPDERRRFGRAFRAGFEPATRGRNRTASKKSREKRCVGLTSLPK